MGLISAFTLSFRVFASLITECPYVRGRLRRLVSDELVTSIMTVVEIAQGAKVIVRALCTLPAHAHDVRLVTLVARDTLVTYSCMQMKTQIEKFVSAET